MSTRVMVPGVAASIAASISSETGGLRRVEERAVREATEPGVDRRYRFMPKMEAQLVREALINENLQLLWT